MECESPWSKRHARDSCARDHSSTSTRPASQSIMPPVPSSSATNTVSPSQHLRLAPSSNRESFARHEIRQLVLEYLISSCYVDSAQAFAREVDLLDKGADRDDTATAGHASGTEAANERGAARIAVANGVKDNDEHAMEGVEATPPPHEPRDDDSAFMDGGDHDAGNGVRSKSTRKVAFEEEEVAEELRDTSMLSTERLREGRLRRGRALARPLLTLWLTWLLPQRSRARFLRGGYNTPSTCSRSISRRYWEITAQRRRHRRQQRLDQQRVNRP